VVVIVLVVAPTLRHIRSSTLSGRGTEGGGDDDDDDDAIDVDVDVVAAYCGDVGESHCVEYFAPILYGLAGACCLARCFCCQRMYK
jgi:hypothetical protein